MPKSVPSLHYLKKFKKGVHFLNVRLFPNILCNLRKKGNFMDISKKLEIISKAYFSSQDIIRLADSKANISLSIQSLLIGIGLSVSILSDAFNKLPDLLIYNSVLFYFYLSITLCFILTSLCGILLTIQTYKSRGPKEESEKKREGLLYFDHIIQFKNSIEYFNKVSESAEGDLLKDYALQIYQLSHIAHQKMKFIKYSGQFLILNLILTIIVLVTGGLISIFY